MHYSAIKRVDISNGPGIRLSLFVSGCTRHCEGCFNSDTWDFESGDKLTDNTIDDIVRTLNLYVVDGLSILGGEPLEPNNVSSVNWLITRVRTECPNKDIWLWSGYTYEELLARSQDTEVGVLTREILSNIDVLVDGPFELQQKDITLRFKGSANQRIIDLAKSRALGGFAPEPVLWTDAPVYAKHEWPDGGVTQKC